MRRAPRLQAWLEQRWYGGVAPEWPLRALAWLFGRVVQVRRTLYRRGWLRSAGVDCPVIVVGNLGIGGAGKTPLTQALVDGLRERGWRPGIVSRGYGGRVRSAMRLPTEPDPRQFGDEPCLLALRTGVPVAVARQRVGAARLLRQSTDVNLLIADDALQHLALQRDLEILVVDARRGFGNGRLLPAGPLREPPERARECDFEVVNGGRPGEPGRWPMLLAIEYATQVGGGVRRSLESFRGEAVHAVAGIADPGRFFDALAAAGLSAGAHAFPDHHPFTATDFEFDDGRPLLMTEKDAVKCLPFARRNWYAVPVEPRLDPSFIDAVHARLETLRRPSR